MTSRITRQTGLTISENEGGSRVTRQAGLVISETVPQTRVTRQIGLVAAKPADVSRVTRQAGLVISEVVPQTRVSRQTMLLVSQTLGEGTQPPALPLVLPNPLPANWVKEVELENVYQSDVTTAYETLAEERRGLRDRPLRRLSVTFTAVSRDEGNQALMNLRRHSREQVPVPLFCDQSPLTSSYSSGLTLDVDTRWRRFAEGVRIYVVDLVGNFSYGTVDELTDSQITLTADLSQAFPVGALCFPVITSEILLRSDAKFVNDSDLTARLRFDEVDGKSAIKLPDYDPSDDFDYYDGSPVIDTAIQWKAGVTASASRAGSRFSSGRSQLTEIQGAEGQLTHKVEFLRWTRELAWPLLRFHDYSRGRVYPFWLLAPEALFTVDDIATTHIDIVPSGNVDDVSDFVPYVAVILKDGSWQIRGLASVTLVSSVWRLTFDSPITIPSSIDLIDRVTSAHFVRNVGDVLSEQWVTNEVVSFDMTVIDLLSERDAPIPDLTEEFIPSGLQDIPDLQIWCDACRNVFDENDQPTKPWPSDQVGEGRSKTWADVRLDTPADHPACRQNTESKRPSLTLFNDPTINKGKPTLGSTTVDPAGPLTNLLLSSNNFEAGDGAHPGYDWNFLANNVSWPTTTTVDTITGPIDGVAGQLLAWQTTFGSNTDRVFQVVDDVLLTVDEIYTASVYVKQETLGPSVAASKITWDILNVSTGHFVRGTYTFATQSLSTTENVPGGAFSDSGKEELANGWTRLWVSLEYSGATGLRCGIYVAGITPSELPNGDDVTSAWAAAQLEQGIDPGSYTSPELQDDSQWSLHFSEGGSEPLTPASDDGLTVVLNVHLPSDSEFSATWFSIRDGSGNLVFYWDDGTVTFHDDSGAELTDLTLNSFNMAVGQLTTAVVRWDSGGSARLYFDGVLQETSSGSETDINNNDVSNAFSTLFQVAGLSIPGTDEVLDLFPFYNSFAIYARALTDAELNQIGAHFASSYGAPWTDI